MSFFKKDELKHLWPFYLDATLSPMLFFAPAFMILYFLGLSFSLFQISLIFTVSFLSTFIFEIPTGAIADLYGRKKSVLLGYFIEAVGFLSLFFFDNYYYILFAFAFIGFGSTFSSGAKEAWIIDLVKKRKGLDKEYFTKSQSFDGFALLLGGFLGALIVGLFGLKSIWLVAFFSFVISISSLTFANENYVGKKSHIKESYRKIKKQTKTSLKYSSKHPVLFWIFVASFIFTFAFLFNEGLSWTPFLTELGLPDYAFGYLWSAFSAAFILSPWVSKKFLKSNTEKSQRNFLAGSILIIALTTLSVIFVEKLLWALAIAIFSIFVFGASIPVQRIYFHKFIPSKLRATIGSVESMIATFAAIIATPLVGFVVDIIGARYTIFLSGILLIPSAIIYYRIKDFDK